ncbi:unnamed protein product [Protopolystoma xenopodis]|uniref:Uncharacterized protein n=1 Tax=Protopolystoma xenopodis TaxID=117903 RepID=A0A3S5A420_9PLAT|nr:unnamed protein product [Protopolystoma xenopodis]
MYQIHGSVMGISMASIATDFRQVAVAWVAWFACQAPILHCRGSSPAEGVDKNDARSKLQSTGPCMRANFRKARQYEIEWKRQLNSDHCGKILLPVLHQLRRNGVNTSRINLTWPCFSNGIIVPTGMECSFNLAWTGLVGTPAGLERRL